MLFCSRRKRNPWAIRADRAKRFERQTTTAEKYACPAEMIFRSRENSGRSSVRPVTPASTNSSTISMPRAEANFRISSSWAVIGSSSSAWDSVDTRA